MILGIGIDIVDISEFALQLQDTASVFVEETFTLGEHHAAHARPAHKPAQHYAVRWAAKEAFVKAWTAAYFGQAPQLLHMDYRNMEIVQDDFGRPALRLHGDVARVFGASKRCHLSLSHDGNFASAVVIIEEIP